MSSYYKTDQIVQGDLSQKAIEDRYSHGYVFTRLGKGVMNQTRSLRINLSDFELTSENRRVLKHVEGLKIKSQPLPLPQEEYDWEISKLAKDFYDTKFGSKTFSTNKARELLTNPFKSNYNSILSYYFEDNQVGYAICFETEAISHYAYPFYYLERFNNNFGMGMMLLAIQRAKSDKRKYIYLGSATKSADKYKLQFKGLEWFDRARWSNDLEELKRKISDTTD